MVYHYEIHQIIQDINHHFPYFQLLNHIFPVLNRIYVLARNHIEKLAVTFQISLDSFVAGCDQRELNMSQDHCDSFQWSMGIPGS